MTWNYRILEHWDGSLAVHEVYYDEAGEPNSCTTNPVPLTAHQEEGVESIKSQLEMMADALDKPALKYSDLKGSTLISETLS